MADTLTDLAKQVADEQKALDGQKEDTRTRVLRMGKLLNQIQTRHKKEQKARKKRGEETQPFDEFCAEQKVCSAYFPSRSEVYKYIRIWDYREGYEPGMSIKEAYKEATKWKKNGGFAPAKEKVTIRKCLPAQLATALGRSLNRLEKYNKVGDWTEVLVSEDWHEEDITALEQALMLTRQEINHSLRKLRSVQESQANAG